MTFTCAIAVLLLCALFLAACGDSSPLSSSWPLPFPTPGQQDLVVVTTSAPLISSTDDASHISGLICDLANAFAQESNVGVRFVFLPSDQVDQELATGKAHIAAVWRSPPSTGRLKTTPPITNTRDMLIQHETSFALDELSDLSGKTVTVVTWTRQAETMQRLPREIPDLKGVEENQSVGSMLSRPPM